MAVTATPVFPQAVNLGVNTIANGDGTTAKTIFTAGSNGSKLEAIIVSSTDTSNRDVNLFLVRSATSYLLTTVKITANSGNTNALPAVNLLGNSQLPGTITSSNGGPTLYLKSGDTLTLAATTTVTSGKLITAIANGGDF